MCSVERDGLLLLSEGERTRLLGLLLLALAIEEWQRERLRGVEIEACVAVVGSAVAQRAVLGASGSYCRTVVAKVYGPLGCALVPSKLLLACCAELSTVLVGEGPVLCACLAKREAQHVWTGYVSRRGHGNCVEIVRLVHTVEVGSRRTVAQYLVVAVACGCAKLVLEVNPRVARHHSASRYLKFSRLLVLFHNPVHYFRCVSRNRKRKERRYRHRLTRHIHQIIHILACFSLLCVKGMQR